MRMTTEEVSTSPVVEETEQVEEAAPVEQDEEFQNAADTESGEEDAQDTEASEPEDKEEIEAGATDAVPDDMVASPAAASDSPVAVASKPDEKDQRADIEKQPYEFDRCTVQIAVQFLPEDGDAKGRPVLLGIRSHLDAPIVRVVRLSELGELPPAINTLMDQLKSELPAREQATKERIEKEKLESLQRRLKMAKPARHSKPATPEKPKTLQAAAAPARTVLTVNQRANAVNQAVDEKQQLAMF